MEKIPTLFEQDDRFKVTPTVRPEATEKLDGMNVRLTVRSGTLVRLEKRRNPSKAQKADGITDGWYVDAVEGEPEDKYLLKAATQT